MSASPLVTALSVGGLLLAVSGCQRPTPGVTLVSGGSTVHTESTSFCFGGPGEDCVENGSTERIGVLRVRAGAAIGVDVDRDLADHGWFLYDADSKQRSELQDGHYLSFTPSFDNRPVAGIINLEVRSTDRVADDAKVTGLWRFQLVLR